MVTRFAAPAGFCCAMWHLQRSQSFLGFFSALTLLTVALQSDACSASIANAMAVSCFFFEPAALAVALQYNPYSVQASPTQRL